MAIATDTLEQALGRLARQIVITPQRSQAAPGATVAFQLVGVPDVISIGEPVPVAVSVQWAVLDAEGEREFAPGEQFVVSGEPNGTRLALRFRPALVEDTQPRQAAPPLARRVRATLTLTAQPPAPSKPVTIERRLTAPVDVLPLLIPSVLALFRNASFAPGPDGAALLVVPSNSSYANRAALDGALLALETSLRALDDFESLATLTQRVRILRGTLDSHDPATVQFRRTDAIGNLNQITLIQRGPLANDIEAEDELSSLILIGPPERKVELYIKRDFDDAAGRLDVEVGPEGATSVGTLHRREPLTVPAGRADVVVAPPEGRTFGNELSSLRLVPPLLHCTLVGTATIEIDHPDAGGETTVDIVVGLAFTADRRTVIVESLPPIETSAATVTHTGGGTGTFDPATGAMAIDVQLNFHIKHPLIVNKDCPITFDLSTGSDAAGRYSETGAPLDRTTGEIELVSVSTFTGGFLEDRDARVVVAGVLSPLP